MKWKQKNTLLNKLINFAITTTPFNLSQIKKRNDNITTATNVINFMTLGKLTIQTLKKVSLNKKRRQMGKNKEGIYETIYGNACEYINGDTAYDIDSRETIPVEMVDFDKFIRDFN